MPGRALRGLGLLDQEVIVIEAHVLAGHELARDVGSGRGTDELLVLGDPLPIAEVLDEPALVALLAGHRDQGPGLGEVAGDAGPDELDLLGGEAAPDDDGSVAGIVGDGLRIHVRHRGRVALRIGWMPGYAGR